MEPARVRYLFLDLNSYFASVEQQENPELMGKPVAVVPTMTDRTCAIAASYEAKAFGIKTGTRIYEAKKMCPNLVVVPARHDIYVDYHHDIIEEVERHVPIETVHSVDEVSCRLIGDECKVENAIRLAKNIKAGIAKNIGPALGCSIGLSVNSYLAKLATELEKPDGLQVVHLHELPARISHMKLSQLPWIGRRMEQRLHEAGIFDADTLWDLQAGRLRQIWNSVMGQRFWYMLHGVQVPPIVTKKSAVSHSHVLAPALRNPAMAHLVARRLMVKAAARLRRMNYWASSAGVSVRFVSGGRWKDNQAIPSTQDSFTMVRAIDDLWQGINKNHGGQFIHQVSVFLGQLSKESRHCGDLFAGLLEEHDDTHHKRISLSRSLDHINKRYGRDTVTLGIQPPIKVAYVGAKIAFARIPEREEFCE